ncbi:beta-lactamase family protein [Candidatus Saccharibacteria bacterium]|nr:MAG: beta-lactamase family protein [Candidatus Saccharibacteria bacterium]
MSILRIGAVTALGAAIAVGAHGAYDVNQHSGNVHGIDEAPYFTVGMEKRSWQELSASGKLVLGIVGATLTDTPESSAPLMPQPNTPENNSAQATGGTGEKNCGSWLKHPEAAEKLRNSLAATVKSSVLDPRLAPGAAVVAGCGENQIVSVGFGSTRYEGGKPIDPGVTKYDLSSLSKPFTAAAIVRAVEAGKLQLDDPVGRFIPEYGVGNKATVTMRQLLGHRAGLKDVRYASIIGSSPNPQAVQKKVLSQPLKETPGKTYAYSNVGFSVAWAVGGKAVGGSLEGVITQNIFQPLGMKNSTYHPQADCAPTSSDYNQKEELNCVQQDSLARGLGGASGHAGVFSTAEDAGKFAAMLANRGTYKGQVLLNAPSVAALTTASTDKKSYALGFRTNANRSYSSIMSPQTFGHTGHNGVIMMVDPETDMWAVLLTNSTFEQAPPDDKKNRAYAAVCDTVGRAFLELSP